MSVRGPRQDLRPVTPPDPSLTTMPVPETRSYAFGSFGPAATGDVQVQSIAELEAQADSATYPKGPEEYYPSFDEIHKLLKGVEKWTFIENDPTWGYYVFVTAYSVNAQKEAFRRFKFNVVKDQDALDGASVDRVREEFRAQIKGLCLDEDSDYYDDTVEKSEYMPPARNLACVLLDEAAIEMLAAIGNLPDDTAEFCIAYNPKTITVVDGFWDRLQQSPQETYRGVGQLGVSGLAEFYMDLTMTADTGAMMDLHPISE